MKTKYLSCFSLSGMIVAILLSSWALANVRDSIRLENYIQRQVESYLSRVLPSNTYLLTVSVDADSLRTQELKNETVDRYLKEENITPPPPPQPEVTPQNENEELDFEILPGLEGIYDKSGQGNITRQPRTIVLPSQEPTRSFREEENKTSKEYTYNDELDIREVSVQVAFDDSLNPSLVQSVKNLIGSKMDTTFGDRATVIFSTIDLDQIRRTETFQEPRTSFSSPEQTSSSLPNDNQDLSVDSPEGSGDEQSEYNSNAGWDYYLDKYNSVIYLLLSVLIFIILLLLFIFFLWLFLRILRKNDRGEEKTTVPTENYPPPEPAIPVTLGRGGRNIEPQHDEFEPMVYEAPNAQAREERFLDQFLKEPLLSRKYFLSLPEDDKNELLSVLLSNATKGVFQDIANDTGLGQDSIFKKDIDPLEIERIREQVFNKHIDGINQYNKIYASQMRDPFSKLSFFTEEELKTIFNSIGIEAAAVIAKNVDSQKMVPYLNQLPEQKRKEFLKVFNLEKEISQGEMEEFKRSLKAKTDDLSRNIFIRKADNKFIKRKLLESSIDKKGFLNSIKTEDPDFYNEYQGYMVDFNDFLEDTSPTFNRTIQSAENEDITLALVGIKNNEARDRILNALPQIRKEFVSGYISSRQNNATREEISEAQDNIVEIYRSYLI